MLQIILKRRIFKKHLNIGVMEIRVQHNKTKSQHVRNINMRKSIGILLTITLGKLGRKGIKKQEV